MKYEVRECPIKFNLKYGDYEGAQTCYFEINGEKYSWWLSYAMGSLFGSMLDAVYGLFIETLDQRHIDGVRYEHDIPGDSSEITSIVSVSEWDNEGEVLEWTFRRDLSRKELMINMTVDYQFGDKVYKVQISLADLSYAVTRALTDYIKRIGFCGYYFAAIYDSIDIVRFLVVKHYALTGEIKKFSEVGYGRKNAFTFEEEMELIKQSM